MKKQRILLLGGNYIPEPTGIGKYNGEMIDWLSKEGYECGVVTSYPYYPYWKAQPPYEKDHSGFQRKNQKSMKVRSVFTGVRIIFLKLHQALNAFCLTSASS